MPVLWTCPKSSVCSMCPGGTTENSGHKWESCTSQPFLHLAVWPPYSTSVPRCRSTTLFSVMWVKAKHPLEKTLMFTWLVIWAPAFVLMGCPGSFLLKSWAPQSQRPGKLSTHMWVRLTSAFFILQQLVSLSKYVSLSVQRSPSWPQDRVLDISHLWVLFKSGIPEFVLRL